jgi:imidazolonepropionase-like amidohydrolase
MTTITRRGVIAGMAGLPLAGMAAHAIAAEPTTILIRNVQVFDGTGSARVPRNVRITGDRISAIASGDIPVPEGATVIDGRGNTLMPGLTDAHWHMSAVKGVPWMGPDDALGIAIVFKDAEFQLQRGFTTVRDTAGSVFGIKAAIDREVMPGPRIFPSGAAISQTSGHGDPGPADEIPTALGGEPSHNELMGFTAVANGVPQVLAATRQQLKRGATQIKIMAGGGVTSDHDPIDTLQFTLEEMRAIVQAAGDWGTYACAHVYTPAGIRRCLEAGVLSIEHGHSLDDPTAALMAGKGAWLSNQPFEAGDNVLTPEQIEKANESIGTGGWEASVRLAKKHGVKVAFGTDLFSRTRTSRTENDMLPRYGRVFGNAETLRIATSGNCELFERSGKRNTYRAAKLGVIREGAWADMLIVKGNPLEKLELLGNFQENLLAIVKNGVVRKNLLG